MLETEELRQLRGFAGKILWLSSQTRPDLSFNSLELSVERNRATIQTLKRANKVARKVFQKKSELFFRSVGHKYKLIVYSDAGFCNLPDGVSSTEGYIILLSGENGSCLLDWASLKIKRKVSSTIEAEVLALKDALNNAIYIGSLISEFEFGDFSVNRVPIDAYIDNKPAEQNIRSTKQVKEKRLRVDICEIQRLLEQKEVNDVLWVSSENQLADGLTKRDVLEIKNAVW